jgi:hypothetical protein
VQDCSILGAALGEILTKSDMFSSIQACLQLSRVLELFGFGRRRGLHNPSERYFILQENIRLMVDLCICIRACRQFGRVLELSGKWQMQ